MISFDGRMFSTPGELYMYGAESMRKTAEIMSYGYNPFKMVSTVSYECGACHAKVDETDKYCRECGAMFTGEKLNG